jgi:hypothetical protein
MIRNKHRIRSNVGEPFASSSPGEHDDVHPFVRKRTGEAALQIGQRLHQFLARADEQNIDLRPDAQRLGGCLPYAVAPSTPVEIGLCLVEKPWARMARLGARDDRPSRAADAED